MDPKNKKEVDIIEEDGDIDYISLNIDPEDLSDEVNFDDGDSDIAILNEEGFDEDNF